MKLRAGLKMKLLICVVALGVDLPPAGAQMNAPDMVRTERAFPTGRAGSSVILLERFTPREVRLGREFQYQIKVTNLTTGSIEDVLLTEQFPLNFRPDAMTPSPNRTEGGRAFWDLGTLGPKGSKLIQARGTTESPGDLNWCATVNFKTLLCATTQIVEPKLELALNVPADVLRCDPIPLRIAVRNTGSGLARNVVVTDTLPSGWTTTRGETTVSFRVGDLAAGQSREFMVEARSLQTGHFVNRVTATEAGGLTAEATAETDVRVPVLRVAASGPDFRYVGRPATYQLTVTNEGDAVAENTMLVDHISRSMQFVSADNNGRFSNDRVSWNLGDIQPGGSRSVSVTFNAVHRGAVTQQAKATANCADAETSTTLEVRGIPAILLEVVDVDDPIEVGSNETYIIKVLNQGSADGTNIVVTCTLPVEQQYISATGPTNGQVQGQTVRFAPLRTLAPKSEAVYRVVVRGQQEGDVRFGVQIESDQITSPVRETESTHIY